MVAARVKTYGRDHQILIGHSYLCVPVMMYASNKPLETLVILDANLARLFSISHHVCA